MQEYGTRCCKDCLIKHTISDYRLEEVNINLNELHDFGLQYRTVDMYNPNSRHGDKVILANPDFCCSSSTLFLR
jgi:hypothetical protein